MNYLFSGEYFIILLDLLRINSLGNHCVGDAFYLICFCHSTVLVTSSPGLIYILGGGGGVLKNKHHWEGGQNNLPTSFQFWLTSPPQ